MIHPARLTTAAVALLLTAVLASAFAQTASPVDPALIEDLVAANRILAEEGVLDAYGHVSIRHPNDPNRYLLSRSRAPILVTSSDIMEYDLESNPIDPQNRRSVIERFIHGEIYKARPDVKAVIHSHSPAVIPFGITQVPMRPVIHAASFLWVGVPVWDSRNAHDPASASMLVRNGALGKSLASTLGDKRVALMRGHGNVVAGPDVRTAVRYAIYTEMNARLQSAAIAIGGPINYISPEEGAARDTAPSDFARAWELWKNKALGR
ncbi:MAG TPA: class II aldolase/adducin family protein [Xanthobacteraceae bacterium]|nr:class II aldolase/adducin family protein [Xanthobacteraceae bacterium]